MAIWHMRTACWIPKTTNTHSEYVIPIAFPLQQWLHERASTLRYTYTAGVVTSYTTSYVSLSLSLSLSLCLFSSVFGVLLPGFWYVLSPTTKQTSSEACQGRAWFQQNRDASCHKVCFFPTRQGAEGNSRHSDRNISFFPSSSGSGLITTPTVHKPIPCYGKNRSTPTAPQNHRFNPNRGLSCLFMFVDFTPCRHDQQHRTTGLLACQTYPLPQYYHCLTTRAYKNNNNIY